MKRQEEKQIKNEVKLKQKTFNKHGIEIWSERRPQQEVINVQWNEIVNEHTKTLSKREKEGKRK